MRDVQFLTLFLEWFKAFSGKHQFTLDKVVGLHFVKGENEDEPDLGSNGAGKSSLWDAIVWCCYGRTVRGLRNPDVRPWNGKGKTRVALLVEVNGKRRTIARTVSPNSLTLDGVDVGPERIVKLLGMTQEMMTNTIILGQRRDLFFDMQPRAKLDLLSDAKRLDRWDDRSKRASDKCRDLEQEHARYVGEIEGIDYAIKQVSEQIGTTEVAFARWGLDMDAKRHEAEAFTTKNEKRLETLQHDLAGYDLKYDGAMTEVKAIQRDISKLQETLRRDGAQLARLRAQRASLEFQCVEIDGQLKGLVGAKRCPTCGQMVSPYNLEKHSDELKRKAKRLIKEHDEKDEALVPIEAAIKKGEKVQARLEADLKVFHAKADDAIRERDTKLPELEKLKKQFDVYQAFKKQSDSEVNPYGKLLRETKRRLSRMGDDRKGARDDRDSCAKELIETKFWPRGFKDIKLHVIEELLQELELTTAGMLEEVGLVGWKVQYAIENETKKGTTANGIVVFIGSPRSKGLVRWEAWSGGEGQRLRLVGALSLASVLLNHAGVDPSMEVLDEPTTSLSDEGVHDLVAYLSDRARRMRRTIFYADHQSIESARFASSVLIRKDRDGSRIARG